MAKKQKLPDATFNIETNGKKTKPEGITTVITPKAKDFHYSNHTFNEVKYTCPYQFSLNVEKFYDKLLNKIVKSYPTMIPPVIIPGKNFYRCMAFSSKKGKTKTLFFGEGKDPISSLIVLAWAIAQQEEDFLKTR